nr:hypothetical protein B0A51_00628 [Rachicladosporium sp. CCFEE 5018]
MAPPCRRLERIQCMLEEVKRRIQEEAKLATLRSSLEATIEASQAEEAQVLLQRNELYAALVLHQEQVHTKAAEIDAAMDAAKARRDGDERQSRHIEAQIGWLQTSALMQALALPESDDPVPKIVVLEPVEMMPFNQKSYLQRQLTALRLYRISEHFVWPEAGMSTDGRIVNEPMYLVMLEHNLCNDKYSSVSGLVNDFKLIAANARTHYGDDHDLTHAAVKMQERFLSTIEAMPAADKNLEACAPEGEVEDNRDTVADEVCNDTSDGNRTVAPSDGSHDYTAGAMPRIEPPRALYRSIRIGRDWTINPKQWDKLSDKRRRSIERARSILDTPEGQVATKTCEGCKAYDRACMVFKDHSTMASNLQILRDQLDALEKKEKLLLDRKRCNEEARQTLDEQYRRESQRLVQEADQILAELDAVRHVDTVSDHRHSWYLYKRATCTVLDPIVNDCIHDVSLFYGPLRKNARHRSPQPKSIRRPLRKAC